MCRMVMPIGKRQKGLLEEKKIQQDSGGWWEKGAMSSSNLEQGGDVRVRPESRLREMETFVQTQWINSQNDRVVTFEQNQGYQPSCKQTNKKQCKHVPKQTHSVRKKTGSMIHSHWICVSRRCGAILTLPVLISNICPTTTVYCYMYHFMVDKMISSVMLPRTIMNVSVSLLFLLFQFFSAAPFCH